MKERFLVVGVSDGKMARVTRDAVGAAFFIGGVFDLNHEELERVENFLKTAEVCDVWQQGELFNIVRIKDEEDR